MKILIPCATLAVLSFTNIQAGRQSILDSIAESYVKLVLDVGIYDEGYVDFYYGPPEWMPESLDNSELADFPYEDLRERAAKLIEQLDAWDANESEEEQIARRSFLRAHVVAVSTRIDMLAGKELTFKDESRGLFDAVPPSYRIEDLKPVLAELDSLIPGTGNLRERLKEYRKRFIIPPEKVASVIQTALDSARNRTKQHLELPDGDSCSLEIVTDKPWRAFNAYKGNRSSIIQLNIDSPVRIDLVLDLACHEGYPGHHVHASFWEKNLYRGKEWIEFSISPLYSPSSLLAEGIAECAMDMVFPGDEALRFEKDVLYPLAGLDTAEADRYNRIRTLVDSLKWVLIIVTQKYLDGELSRDQAIGWLKDYALMSAAAAERTIPAIEMYRSYAITYKLGKIMVRDWINADAESSNGRWQAFYELMTTPKIPSEL